MNHHSLTLVTLLSLAACTGSSGAAGPDGGLAHDAERAASANATDAATDITARPAFSARPSRELAPAARPTQPLEAIDQFAPVLTAGGLHVVLATATDPAWGRGAPVLVSAGRPVIVRREVDTAALPARLANRLGSKVRLLDAAGERCEATLGGFALVARVEPHFGMRQEWSGENSDPPARPASPAAIAQAAWDLTEENGRVLTAEVRALRGDCTGATWARSFDLAVPAMAAAGVADEALRREALAQFRGLRAYRALQRAFVADAAGHARGRWDESDGARLAVVAMALPERGATLVSVAADVNNGCGAFAGSLAAQWEVTATPDGARFALRGTVDTGELAAPVTALDVDGDGRAEVLLADGSLVRTDAQGYRVQALPLPNFDCPC